MNLLFFKVECPTLKYQIFKSKFKKYTEVNMYLV